MICSEILTSVMSCLRVAEVEREQPGARGNRWNLQEGQEFAEIWPFWRIKLCSKAMGILRDFPLSYQTLIRSWVILGKLYVDLSNFWGYFFFWGRVSILWSMVHEVWVGGWPLDSGPVQCFSTAQWVEPHHLWWVLLGLHGWWLAFARMWNVWKSPILICCWTFLYSGFWWFLQSRCVLQKEMEFLSGAGLTTMWKASHSTHSTAKAWKLLLLFTSLDQFRFPHKIQSDLCYLCSLISNMFMKTAGAFSEKFCMSFRSQCGWKPPIRVHHAPSLHGFANSPTATGGVKRFRYIKQHATSISEKLHG